MNAILWNRLNQLAQKRLHEAGQNQVPGQRAVLTLMRWALDEQEVEPTDQLRERLDAQVSELEQSPTNARLMAAMLPSHEEAAELILELEATASPAKVASLLLEQLARESGLMQ